MDWLPKKRASAAARAGARSRWWEGPLLKLRRALQLMAARSYVLMLRLECAMLRLILRAAQRCFGVPRARSVSADQAQFPGVARRS